MFSGWPLSVTVSKYFKVIIHAIKKKRMKICVKQGGREMKPVIGVKHVYGEWTTYIDS